MSAGDDAAMEMYGRRAILENASKNFEASWDEDDNDNDDGEHFEDLGNNVDKKNFFKPFESTHNYNRDPLPKGGKRKKHRRSRKKTSHKRKTKKNNKRKTKRRRKTKTKR
jgi:hypothetical protein